MKTPFSFGKSGIEVSLPDGYECQVVRSHTAAAVGDASAAVATALDRPIGCEPLAKLAVGKRTAAISVCDITRPAPNSITLPPLLARLHAAGIPIEGITILIATGLHRGATKEEIKPLSGRRSQKRIALSITMRATLPGIVRWGQQVAEPRFISMSGSWLPICTSRWVLLSST